MTLTITPVNYPTIYEVLATLSNDQGANILPVYYIEVEGFNLVEMEAILATLTSEELEDFCIGDADEEMAEIANRSPELSRAHEFINELFEQEIYA